MAWAILLYRWRIDLFHVAIILMLGIGTNLVSWYVDQPIYWVRATTFVMFCAVAVYIYNLRVRALMNLPTKRTKLAISIYIGYIIGCILLSIWLSLINTQITQIIVGLISVLVSSSVWIRQMNVMKIEGELRKIP
jgi:hypothetical protein